MKVSKTREVFLKVCNEHLQYLCVYTHTQMHTAGGRGGKRGKERKGGGIEKRERGYCAWLLI